MSIDAATAVDELYRSDWGTDRRHPDRHGRRLRPRGRVRAGGLCGSGGPVADLRRPGISARLDHPDRPPQSHRPLRHRTRSEEKLESYAASGMVRSRGAGLRHERDSRRPPSADLHLLPSRPRSGSPGGAHAPHVVRPGNRRDCTGVSGTADHHGAETRARQAQDSRRRHSLRCARDEGHAPSGSMPSSP